MKDNNNYTYMIIIGIIYLLNCLFLFLINCTICTIHIREPIMRSNFFKVVFVQLILETSINILLITLILAILISGENKEWFLIFHTLLNYFRKIFADKSNITEIIENFDILKQQGKLKFLFSNYITYSHIFIPLLFSI